MIEPTKRHWREYAIEAGAMATFMISASTLTVVLEHPASPVRALLPSAIVRRSLMGMAMGLTAASIIYSPWGRRSGAHMNPAVTLAFFRLGKIARVDALGYVASQFVGSVAGVALAVLAFGARMAEPHVNYVATVPGVRGSTAAFGAEIAISFALMLAVLSVSNAKRLASFTGVTAALLVATFITVEAPLSGMSMNPARSLGPDVVGEMWRGLWIYFIAPPLGMLAAAQAFVALRGHHAVRCAKLHHDDGPCIFACGMGASATVNSTPANPETRELERSYVHPF